MQLTTISALRAFQNIASQEITTLYQIQQSWAAYWPNLCLAAAQDVSATILWNELTPVQPCSGATTRFDTMLNGEYATNSPFLGWYLQAIPFLSLDPVVSVVINGQAAVSISTQVPSFEMLVSLFGIEGRIILSGITPLKEVISRGNTMFARRYRALQQNLATLASIRDEITRATVFLQTQTDGELASLGKLSLMRPCVHSQGAMEDVLHPTLAWLTSLNLDPILTQPPGASNLAEITIR